MLSSIKVNYKATSNLEEATQWLEDIKVHPVIACDFEVSTKYTPEDLESFKEVVENLDLPKLTRMEARAKLESDALSHPSHTMLTHLSIAWSESDSIVLILDSDDIIKLALHFLLETPQKQVWHNATYDFKHLYHYTHEFPQNYEDTAILAKTILNHVEISKATVGLKELAGPAYGAWGISEDCFHYSQMYEPKVLHYAATDSCATVWIWNRMQEHLKESNNENLHT